MKYLWTTMHVKDMDASVKFYQDVVGLEQEWRRPAGTGVEITFLKSQDTNTKVELICEENFAGQAENVALSLGFAVKNLEGKREVLEAAGYHPSPIISPNPMTKFFFIKDPDGIGIQFVEEN